MIRFLILSHPDRRELGSVEVPVGTNLLNDGIDRVVDAFARAEGFADHEALVAARPEFAVIHVEHAPMTLAVIEGGRS